MQVETVGQYVSSWGEGPLWYNDQLLYVDIEDHKVVRYDPATDTEQVVDVGERVGTVVPRVSGGLVIAGDSGFRFLDLATSKTAPIADPEPEIESNRFNDGKCDPAGRFWAGTISMNKTEGAAKLYCLDNQGNVAEKYGPVTNSNGICWTGDASTMYYIDTPRKQILAFDFDNANGDIQNERVVMDTSHIEGSPDGMVIDCEDKLWVAFCRGSSVHRLDPGNGESLLSIQLPCSGATAPAFGGADLRDLYITTGQFPGAPEEGAGRLYRVRTEVQGTPFFAYGG